MPTSPATACWTADADVAVLRTPPTTRTQPALQVAPARGQPAHKMQRVPAATPSKPTGLILRMLRVQTSLPFRPHRLPPYPGPQSDAKPNRLYVPCLVHHQSRWIRCRHLSHRIGATFAGFPMTAGIVRGTSDTLSTADALRKGFRFVAMDSREQNNGQNGALVKSIPRKLVSPVEQSESR